jgi:hypothetical protein
MTSIVIPPVNYLDGTDGLLAWQSWGTATS